MDQQRWLATVARLDKENEDEMKQSEHGLHASHQRSTKAKRRNKFGQGGMAQFIKRFVRFLKERIHLLFTSQIYLPYFLMSKI